MSAIGKTWHPEHFCCSSCNVSLQNQAFVEENGQLFCEKCYNSFYAPKCAHCNQAIIGVSRNCLFPPFREPIRLYPPDFIIYPPPFRPSCPLYPLAALSPPFTSPLPALLPKMFFFQISVYDTFYLQSKIQKCF